MLRCQFLCHVSKALFFIKIALKLSYFCKKCNIFKRWGLCPQTACLRRLGVLPPDLQSPAAGGFAPRPSIQPPHCKFLATPLTKKVLKLSHFCKKRKNFFCVFSETPSKVTNFNISHMRIQSVESMSNNLASALLFFLCLFCARSSLFKIGLT